ncbi:hypothetical protein LZ31DRAFT_106145 [Colletotrichum somersetense]|nr:hypothetical protein LZ31DRAFT_106145 [Colletotrichum somersetense]
MDHGASGLDQASHRSGCLVIWSKARHSISHDHLRGCATHVDVFNALPSPVLTPKSHPPRTTWLSSTRRSMSLPALSSFLPAQRGTALLQANWMVVVEYWRRAWQM